jgi:hypothetical protein
VVEKSPIGTVVGTVTGFDFAPNATLTYSMVDSAGSRFAINASTGELTVAGAINYDDASSLQVTVRVSDGAHVFDQPFTINVIDLPNHAPVVSQLQGAGMSIVEGRSLQVSGMFSASDADGDALRYFLYDTNADNNSGHVLINGTAMAAQTVVELTAAQLAQATYVAGAAGTADGIYLDVFDGQAYSGWLTGVYLTATANHAPVVSQLQGAGMSIVEGRSLQVSGMFSASDADGDALRYFLYDTNADNNSGHVLINGTAMAAQTIVELTAAQLAQATYVAGAAGTADGIYLDVFDGQAYSGWLTGVYLTATANHAPQVSLLAGANVVASAGQSMQASSLFSASDADGDPLSYVLYDNTVSAGGGHFMLDGAAVPSDVGVLLTAAQSHNSVAESAANGTVIGTVSTYDLQPGAVLNYSVSASRIHPDRNRRKKARRAVGIAGCRRAQRPSARHGLPSQKVRVSRGFSEKRIMRNYTRA